MSTSRALVEAAPAWLHRIASDGLQVELYAKDGRSRRLSWTAGAIELQRLHEQGWAVRMGGAIGSAFRAGTGAPPTRSRRRR